MLHQTTLNFYWQCSTCRHERTWKPGGQKQVTV